MRGGIRPVVKACVFGVALLLGACVTTAKPVFGTGDYVQPKSIAGDWISQAEKGDVMRVRVSVQGSLFHAQPLTEKGEVDTSDDPIDFGLVPLGGDEFVFVQADDSDGPATYLGVEIEHGQMKVTIFAGGSDDATKAKFNALIASLGMSRDTSFTYEARLTGDVSAEKIKKLFKALLEDPKAYDGQTAVYKPLTR